MIPFVIHEDLGLVFESAKSGGMHNPVPVPLKTGAGRAFRFGVKAPPALIRIAGIRGAIDKCHSHEFLAATYLCAGSDAMSAPSFRRIRVDFASKQIT